MVVSCKDPKGTITPQVKAALDPCVAQALDTIELEGGVSGDATAKFREVFSVGGGAEVTSKATIAFQSIPDEAAKCQIVAKVTTCGINAEVDEKLLTSFASSLDGACG